MTIFLDQTISKFFSALKYTLDYSKWFPFLAHSVHGAVPGLFSQLRYLFNISRLT